MMEKQSNGVDAKCNSHTSNGYWGKRAPPKKAIECRKDISVKYLVRLHIIFCSTTFEFMFG